MSLDDFLSAPDNCEFKVESEAINAHGTIRIKCDNINIFIEKDPPALLNGYQCYPTST